MTTHATTRASTFGPLLRQWRQTRSYSQARLAADAEVSTRHLSFLETGRSAPSREMVLILTSALDLPLRERNTLLGAAGFAPVYRESPLASPEMAGVRRALEHVLAQQEPYGAVVVDRLWNVQRMNQGALRMLGYWLDPRTTPPIVTRNMLHAVFHPAGLRPCMVNWEAVAGALAMRVHREALEDEALRAELDKLLAYPDVPKSFAALDLAAPQEVLLPVHLRRGEVEVRLFSMLSTIGTPLDVTAAELRVESYFPADDASDAWIRSLVPASLAPARC